MKEIEILILKMRKSGFHDMANSLSLIKDKVPGSNDGWYDLDVIFPLWNSSCLFKLNQVKE